MFLYLSLILYKVNAKIQINDCMTKYRMKF